MKNCFINYILLLIIFCILIVILVKSNYNFKVNSSIEGFENFKENNIDPNNRNIWLYWENKPGKKKPVYIDLCYKTIDKNCKNFRVHKLNEKNIYDYLPDLRKDINKLKIPQKADYIRYRLLNEYGGIWLDSDIIVINDLSPILDYFDKYDFIGFGCHYGALCSSKNNGYPKPANWALVCMKGGPLMKMMVEKCNNKLDKKGVDNIRRNYHSLGRNLLWLCIKELRETGWDYYHYDSKCLERDSDGKKIENFRVLQNKKIDKHCKKNYLFIPIYNTAPGFPDWFLNMSYNELLNGKLLISRLFRLALGINN